jgi:MHS family proline/betaine transporter-like MFS transporter
MTTDIETVAGVLGNVLEWYDFALYGYLSDIIAQVFFPPVSDSSSLLWSYAVFGGAFLMRPIGGMITGHTGDKNGRKGALVMSMVMMAIPTFSMGCLPSYESVGWVSTFLLVVCRLVQGMSVGGQLPSSLVFTVERQPKESWGYYGALVIFASGIGVLLGNIVGAIIRTVLTEEELLEWGWRIPFLSGILIGVIALLIQIFGNEYNPNADFYGHDDELSNTNDRSLESEDTTISKQPTHPLKESFRKENLRALIASALVPMLAGANYYVTFVWMAVYMETILDPPIPGAFWINACASFFGSSIPCVAAGWISDSHDRVKMMMIGAFGTGIISPFMIWVISLGKAVPAFLAQFTIGVVSSLLAGPMTAWLAETFPPHVRLTAGSLGYNIAICASSGFSPLLATALVNRFGPIAPGAIYPFFAFLSIIGLILSKGNQLQNAGSSETEQSVEVHPIC